MNVFKPSLPLQPYITSYLIIKAGQELVNRVLPDTTLAIAFRYKGHVSYIADDHNQLLPATVISGLRKSVRLIRYEEGTETIIIRFRETGAKAFFKEPLHELFSLSISMDHFIGRMQLSLIEEQLAEADSDNKRIAVIEQFLIAALKDQNSDILIDHALKHIYQSKGNTRIRTLAKDLYISQDAFEKRFRKIVGATPKQFSCLVRLKSTIAAYQKQKLTGFALDNGYFDQPHFNKEFRLFTGQSPTEFFSSGSYW